MQEIGRHLAIGVALSMGIALPAGAESSLTLAVPEGLTLLTSSPNYRCGNDNPIRVEYKNFGRNALALIPVEGQTLIFVRIDDGAGRFYASGPYEWWIEARSAVLTDTRNGQEQTCRQQPLPLDYCRLPLKR